MLKISRLVITKWDEFAKTSSKTVRHCGQGVGLLVTCSGHNYCIWATSHTNSYSTHRVRDISPLVLKPAWSSPHTQP